MVFQMLGMCFHFFIYIIFDCFSFDFHLHMNVQLLTYVSFFLQDITGWGENDRGVSYTFGGDIVKEYLRRFSCSLIARAHQVTSYFIIKKNP